MVENNPGQGDPTHQENLPEQDISLVAKDIFDRMQLYSHVALLINGERARLLQDHSASQEVIDMMRTDLITLTQRSIGLIEAYNLLQGTSIDIEDTRPSAAIIAKYIPLIFTKTYTLAPQEEEKRDE